MKKVVLLSAICFILTFSAYSQCVEKPQDPCVSVNQSLIDRAMGAAKELVEARDALTKFAAERTVHDAERKAAAVLIDNLNALVATGQRIQDEQAKVIALYKEVAQMYSTLVDKLTAQLQKPQSGWGKLVGILKTIGAILAGVTLARGL